jgi:hypothetical protein
LVNSEDEAALVENLDFMMTHLHQFNPKLIRKKIVETCSYDAVGQAIVNIYQIIVKDAILHNHRRL